MNTTVTLESRVVQFHWGRFLGTLGLAILSVGCADSTDLEPVLVQMVSGDSQQTQVGAALPEPLVVRVTDLDGTALGDVRIDWSVREGEGSLEPVNQRTGGNGEGKAWWTVSEQPGVHRAEAMVRGQRLEFSAWATPEPPEDWSDVTDVEVTSDIDAGQIQVEVTLTNDWAGAIAVTTANGCLAVPALYDSEDVRAADPGFQFGCTAWERTYELAPGESLLRLFTTPVDSLAPGTYTVRVAFNVVEINGTPTSLSEAHSQVVVQ